MLPGVLAPVMARGTSTRKVGTSQCVTEPRPRATSHERAVWGFRRDTRVAGEGDAACHSFTHALFAGGAVTMRVESSATVNPSRAVSRQREQCLQSTCRASGNDGAASGTWSRAHRKGIRRDAAPCAMTSRVARAHEARETLARERRAQVGADARRTPGRDYGLARRLVVAVLASKRGRTRWAQPRPVRLVGLRWRIDVRAVASCTVPRTNS